MNKKLFFLAYESGYDYFFHQIRSHDKVLEQLKIDNDVDKETVEKVLQEINSLQIGDVLEFGYGSIIRIKNEN
jgi:hypothetical protein